MIERLEVTPGPGTVIRYGHVAVWVGPDASAALLTFLTESARNLAFSPSGGLQLADHLAGVLRGRDPEPHVALAVVGPGPEGWASMLHGPVQMWDGVQWTAPPPQPGWLHTTFWPRPTLSVTPASAPAPAVAPDSIWNLEAGVVPGGGMIMIPIVRSPLVAVPPLGEPPSAEPSIDRPPIAGSAVAGSSSSSPAETAIGDQAEPMGQSGSNDYSGPDDLTAVIPVGDGDATEVLDLNGGLSGAVSPEAEAPGRPGPPGSGSPRPTGEPAPFGTIVDLRSTRLPPGRVTYPPLPPGGGPAAPTAGAPVVAGVLCHRGHINRPGMTSCARCQSSLQSDGAYPVSGTRPALGCLIADDGAVYRLDTGYLVGGDPREDPTVRGHLARPLLLPGQDVAASHAEIRLHDWDVVLTDRAAPGGTFVYEPESTAWERLRPYDRRVLKPGTHVAIGQRILTFVTPWLAGH